MLARFAAAKATRALGLQQSAFWRQMSQYPPKTYLPTKEEEATDFPDKSIKITRTPADMPPPPKEGPERDIVNFPMMPIPLYTSPVRHAWVPESWFQIFYEKTGYTGSYAFFFTTGVFLLSKEYFILEHQFYEGLGLWTLLIIMSKAFGEKVGKWVYHQNDVDEYEKKKFIKDEIGECQKQIDIIHAAKENVGGQLLIVQAKRENVGLQLEAEYRSRISQVYNAVKQRLDYQIENQNARRRVEQKHMSEWIINNVMKGITPQQEKEALNKCIADLKAIAARAN